LDDLEINKENNSFKERIDFINNFIESNNAQDDNFNLQKYFNKFSSRYNAKVTIEGDRPSNYKLNAKLNGYLDVFRDDNKNKKEEFSIDLQGGLLKGNGSLKIKNLPLSASNIFLNQDFLIFYMKSLALPFLKFQFEMFPSRNILDPLITQKIPNHKHQHSF